MAFNHNITSQIELENSRGVYDISSTIIKPLEILKPAFKNYQEGYQYLIETSEKVISKMKLFNTDEFSYGYCHYDYLPKNFHFHENELTVFDYDFSGRGYLVNDLMTFMVHYFFYVIIKGMPKEEADRHFNVFIEGYKENRQISKEELEAIPYLGFMFWTFYLGFQYQNFDDWSNTFFGTPHLKKWVMWVRKWEELYCEF
jgi:Ser/Thr protein kinase RdoA (MazF antagonist)